MSSTKARMANIEANFPVKDEKRTRGSSVTTVTAKTNLIPGRITAHLHRRTQTEMDKTAGGLKLVTHL